MTSEDTPQNTKPPVPLSAFVRYFLGLGIYGFGGPIATVGYMQRDLVEKRGWLDREDFLNGVALGQTMPGPLAAQVAMWVGFLRAGPLGSLAIAAPFILPSFVLVVGVAYLYQRYQGLAVLQSLFYGIAPAVMAILVIAAIKLARLTNRKDSRLWVTSIIVLAVTAATSSEIALLFIGAGLFMMLWEAPPKWAPWNRSTHLSLLAGIRMKSFWVAAASSGVFGALFLFFLKAGAFIFGSGLAIVPFLREGVVHQHHWLTERQFLDAVAVGLITPGPVVIAAAFIGFLVAGFTGALIASVGIFTPIYLGVVVPGRWFIKHKDHPSLKAFVRGATAAAAGAIGGATIVLIRQAIKDWQTLTIAVVALVVLWRFKWKEPIIVLLAAGIGLLIYR
ncbi:MAG: chromate efflux transporter [Actinomycetota bacterium]